MFYASSYYYGHNFSRFKLFHISFEPGGLPLQHSVSDFMNKKMFSAHENISPLMN